MDRGLEIMDFPLGLRVLVTGANRLKRESGLDARAVRDFASDLGRALGRLEPESVVLLTGGREDRWAVDRAVAAGFIETDRSPDEAGRHCRLVALVEEGRVIDAEGVFSSATQRTSGSTRQARRFQLALAADVIVSVSGGGGTTDGINLGFTLQRPTLPLRFTGGVSRAFWEGSGGGFPEATHLQRRVRAHFPDECVDVASRNDLPAAKADREALAEDLARWIVDAAMGTCFVAMPFPDTGTPKTPRLLEEAAARANLRCTNAGMTLETGKIHDEMLRQIRDATIVVGILHDGPVGGELNVFSGNDNVLYEVGYAHGCGVPTVLISTDPAQAPFDVRADRFIQSPDFWSETVRVTDGQETVRTLEKYLRYAAGRRPAST